MLLHVLDVQLGSQLSHVLIMVKGIARAMLAE